MRVANLAEGVLMLRGDITAGVLGDPSIIPDFYAGDANEDGTVDATDAAILASNWLMSGASWGDGDLNGDETVNDIDATMMAANWLKSKVASTASVCWFNVNWKVGHCGLAG